METVTTHKITLNTQDMSKLEWLKERQKGIGGSDVAAILGLSKYRTPLDVYEEKVSDVPIQSIETPRMKAGIRLEQVIADWFAEESGKKVIMDNKIRKHREYPFLIANLDRVILAQNGEGTGVLECKTTNSFYARSWETEIPMEYYCQLQHYLAVTGWKWGELAILIDGYDFKRFYFDRDEEFITGMIEKLKEFWGHVENRIIPSPINEADVLKLFPQEQTGKVITATPELTRMIQELKTEKDRVKYITLGNDKLEESLKLLMGDAEAIQDSEGKVLITWKAAKDSQTFNSKLFKTKHPDLYSEFTETKQGSRRFILK